MDASVEGKDTDGVLAEIQTYKPNMVGITVFTNLYAQAKEIVKRVKREFSQIITVAGGPHVTVLPEQTLRDMEPDYIVVGEGEVTTLELVKALESQGSTADIMGVGSAKNGIVKVNPRTDFIVDLDALPFPARHLMKIKKYDGARAKVFPPKTTILASRGCQFNCGFCCNSSLWQKKCRQRSPQSVVKEMIDIHNNFGIKYIQFSDDLFSANKAWVREICREIVDTGIGFTWNCQTRVDTLDRETMEIMRNSGCQTLFFGVESGSELILENMNKKITIPKAIKAFSWTKELNFCATLAFFIIGYIGETRDTVKETMDLAQKLNPDSVTFSMATPIPGTDFHKQAMERKLIVSNNWGDYDFLGNSVSRTEALSSEDLLRLRDKAYILFYSRKEYLWENVISKIAKGCTHNRSSMQHILTAVNNLRLFLLFLLKSIICHFHQASEDRTGRT